MLTLHVFVSTPLPMKIHLREPLFMIAISLLSFLLCVVPVNAGAVRPGFDVVSLGANDDGSTGLVPIGFVVNFSGTSYTQLYVNNNGNVTFDASQSTYTPFPIATTSRIIIAPFFADVDTRGAGSGLARYSSGGVTVNGRPAFGVTWDGVGYYNSHSDKLNSFQLVLVDRSDVELGAFDIEFNYDSIQWETGDQSGGSNGVGGSSARVGYANGQGVTVELPGSGVNGGLLDSNLMTGLINSSRDSGVSGRYIFSVRGGAVQNTQTLPATDVSANTAVLHATIEPSGQPTQGYFEYATDPALVGATSTVDVALGSGVGAVALDLLISGLRPNTTYYFRAVSTRPSTTIKGSTLAFTTAPTGFVDPDFNPGADGAVFTTVVQPDGKVVLGGDFTHVGGAPHACIARLNADGNVDVDFNPGASGEVLCVAVQADGKLLIGGAFTSVNGIPRAHVARLNGDGTLDMGFDPGSDGIVRALVLQPDGKIVIAGGFGTVAGMSRSRLARLDENGTLDASFDPGADGEVYTVALQADGRLVVGGAFANVGGVARKCLARLDTMGGVDGFIANADDVVRTVLVQTDGHIIAGGAFTSLAETPRSRLARLDASGALEVEFDPAPNGEVFTSALQVDGSIIFGGGFTMVGGSTRHRIARLGANGVLDEGFDPDVGADFAYSLAIQEDGRVLVGGDFTSVGASVRNRIARLENGPATHGLSVVDSTRMRWMRGGTAPEAQAVTFELSMDGGAAWALLGSATPVIGGWELAGLNLPNAARVRARARLASGVGAASSGVVETVGAYRLPQTIAATDITATTATLHGSADPAGAPLIGRFEYGTDPALVGALATPDVDLGSGVGAVPLDQAVAGLRPNTTYYFHVVTPSSLGMNGGETLSFQTATAPPSVTTLAATALSADSAALHASADAFGQATTGFFEYGRDPALADATATVAIDLGNAQGMVALDELLDGLLDGTTYYYRAVATNGTGTTLGAILSFTTISLAPTVTLLPGDSIMVSAATVHAVVNPHGQLTVGRFEYGTDPGLVGATVLPNVSLGSGAAAVAFDRRLAALEPATTYYYRATAQNAAGTTSSGIGTFTTAAVVPQLTQDSGEAVSGDPEAPVFVDFGIPAVDGGNVGGMATVRTIRQARPRSVIYGGPKGSVLLQAGGNAPENTTWVSFGDPVFGGEAFAFTAVTEVQRALSLPLMLDERFAPEGLARAVVHKPGSLLQALFSQLSIAAGVKRVAVQGGRAPGVGTGIFNKFPNFALPRNRAGVIYTGFMKPDGQVTKQNNFGIWREKTTGGESELVLRKGYPVVPTNGGTRTVRDLSFMIPVENASDQRRSVAPDGGFVAAAKFGDGSNGVIRMAPDGSIDIPLDASSPATDENGVVLSGVQFTEIKAPATATGGAFAFLATLQKIASGAPPAQSVYRSFNGTLRRLVSRFDFAPGYGEDRITALEHPVMGPSGYTAFVAALTRHRVPGKPKRPNDRGILIDNEGAKTVVMRIGEPAHGIGGGATYRRILSYAVPDTLEGRLVFTATIAGPGVKAASSQGLWSVSPTGVVRLLLRTGTDINLGDGVINVRSFQALQSSRKNGGQGRSTDEIGNVVAKVKLRDGRSGVLRIPLP